MNIKFQKPMNFLNKLPKEIRLISCEEPFSKLTFGSGIDKTSGNQYYFVKYAPESIDIPWCIRYTLQFVGDTIEECAEKMYNHLVEHGKLRET